MAFFMNSFKYTIFLVNLIFFGLGVYLFYNTYGQLDNDVFNLDSALKSPIYFTLAIAAVIILISFLGCCGTCYEYPCMIKAYASLIFICVVLEIAVVVMAYRIDPNEISKGIKDDIIEKFDQQSSSVQKSIQLIQYNNKCCGVDGWKDYSFASKVPDSCCGKYDEKSSTNNTIGHCSESELNQKEFSKGCKSRLQELISENYKYVYIIIGCVFGFQLLVIILSCALSKNIKEQYNVV